MADSLFHYRFFREAASEYRRSLAAPDAPADTTWLKLGLSLGASGALTEAADALHRAADLNAELTQPALLALAGFYARNRNTAQARLELSDLLLFADSSSSAQLHAARAWLLLQELNLDAAHADLANAGSLLGDQEAQHLTIPNARSPLAATILSSFLPGAGEIYAGRVGSGLLSLLVTGSAGAAMYYSVRSGDLVTAAVIFTTLFLRFYNGSRRNAADFAEEYNRRLLRSRATALSAECEMIMGGAGSKHGHWSGPDWFQEVRWFTGPDFPPETESLPTPQPALP